MLISIISKQRVTDAEVEYMKSYYWDMVVIPISGFHIVVRSKDLLTVEEAELYTSLSVESIMDYYAPVSTEAVYA